VRDDWWGYYCADREGEAVTKRAIFAAAFLFMNAMANFVVSHDDRATAMVIGALLVIGLAPGKGQQ
jgi:hypothetical protein